jgi:hypothetical protein
MKLIMSFVCLSQGSFGHYSSLHCHLSFLDCFVVNSDAPSRTTLTLKGGKVKYIFLHIYDCTKL